MNASTDDTTLAAEQPPESAPAAPEPSGLGEEQGLIRSAFVARAMFASTAGEFAGAGATGETGVLRQAFLAHLGDDHLEAVSAVSVAGADLLRGVYAAHIAATPAPTPPTRRTRAAAPAKAKAKAKPKAKAKARVQAKPAKRAAKPVPAKRTAAAAKRAPARGKTQRRTPAKAAKRGRGRR